MPIMIICSLNIGHPYQYMCSVKEWFDNFYFLLWFLPYQAACCSFTNLSNLLCAWPNSFISACSCVGISLLPLLSTHAGVCSIVSLSTSPRRGKPTRNSSIISECRYPCFTILYHAITLFMPFLFLCTCHHAFVFCTNCNSKVKNISTLTAWHFYRNHSPVFCFVKYYTRINLTKLSFPN